jgi:hypothetical protein
LPAQEQAELQGLLGKANELFVQDDYAGALAAAEKVIARVDSRMAYFEATEAACMLGDATRARRYYGKIGDANLEKVTLDLCAAKDIFVTEAARNSRWAVFNRLQRARGAAAAALGKHDWAAALAAAKVLIADGQDQDDRDDGHEYAVRAACGLGDAAAAQKYLAGAEASDQSGLIDDCRRNHGLTLTAP